MGEDVVQVTVDDLLAPLLRGSRPALEHLTPPAGAAALAGLIDRGR